MDIAVWWRKSNMLSFSSSILLKAVKSFTRDKLIVCAQLIDWIFQRMRNLRIDMRRWLIEWYPKMKRYWSQCISAPRLHAMPVGTGEREWKWQPYAWLEDEEQQDYTTSLRWIIKVMLEWWCGEEANIINSPQKTACDCYYVMLIMSSFPSIFSYTCLLNIFFPTSFWGQKHVPSLTTMYSTKEKDEKTKKPN